jgi:hypothetical protein
MKLPLVGAIPDSLKTYLRDGNGTDSLKRLVSWMAATTLCVFGYGLLLTIEYQVAVGKPIDPILRDCFIAVVGFVATLAMVAYRKPDAPIGGSSDESPKA